MQSFRGMIFITKNTVNGPDTLARHRLTFCALFLIILAIY